MYYFCTSIQSINQLWNKSFNFVKINETTGEEVSKCAKKSQIKFIPGINFTFMTQIYSKYFLFFFS